MCNLGSFCPLGKSHILMGYFYCNVLIQEEAEVSQKPDSVDNDEDDDGPNNPDEDIEI